MKDQKDITKHFECGICYEVYNNQDRTPRILMCGHTFCQKCISRIIQTQSQFSCPMCKNNLGKLRFGATYKNISLLNLMQVNQISFQEEVSRTIVKQTYQEIVHEMDKLPKSIKSLIIKRTRDDEKNPFQFDLIRKNKISMRFYKLLPTLYKLQHFQLWVKFSAHGFEECLAESLIQLKNLKTVKIVNAYDQFERLHQIISHVGNEKVAFDIVVSPWQ